MLRANQLAAWGVSGITTDNLSMLAALNHSPVQGSQRLVVVGASADPPTMVTTLLGLGDEVG